MYCDRSRRGGLILTALMALGLLVSGGCEELGVMAGKVVGTQEVPAAYAGLQGQRIGVMVWADAGVVIDHPRIFADVANGLQNKLQQARDANVKELTGASSCRTDLILQYQDAHPEAQSDSAEQVAAKLPLTRLIYVELASFTLHPNDSLDLSRGSDRGREGRGGGRRQGQDGVRERQHQRRLSAQCAARRFAGAER